MQTLDRPASQVPPAAAAIDVKVIGELEVSGPQGSFAPGAARPGALLALLVMRAGECLSVDRLVDELWPARADSPGSKRLHVNVVRLRRALARIAPGVDPTAIVRTRSCGYTLAIDPERIDAVRFARLVARGRALLEAGDAPRALRTLDDALALWRGDAYADFAYEAFAAAEIRRLEELQVSALEARVEAELELGRHATVVPELERLVARHPRREQLCALLMIALYRCARQCDALAAYHATRRELVDGLGVEPGAQLRALERAILEQSPSLELGARGLRYAA